jgi:hypothetical protein
MEKQNEWVFFKDIDWNCQKNNNFNIDTRDFHVGYNFNEKPHKDWLTISKYNHFFLTENELKEVLNRLFEESGGVGEWRMMDLIADDNRVRNWNLKYLRIYRTEKGFLVCNSEHQAIRKELLNSKVDKHYLCHH